MTERAKRRYDSPLRRERAKATRRQVLAAAAEVMLERGYAATTVAEVAARAGVAVPTLYASCPGGKPGLARAVYDTILAGDDEAIPQRDRPEVQAIIDEPDPARKLERYATMAVGIDARVAPVLRILRAAAATDVDAAELVARADAQRLAGTRGPTAHLAALDLLRPGLSAEQAAAEIYALTGPDMYDKLVVTCGWSAEDHQKWLARLLIATLLDTDHTAPDDGT
jgi:AcrR family transcriptional regulator